MQLLQNNDYLKQIVHLENEFSLMQKYFFEIQNHVRNFLKQKSEYKILIAKRD